MLFTIIIQSNVKEKPELMREFFRRVIGLIKEWFEPIDPDLAEEIFKRAYR